MSREFPRRRNLDHLKKDAKRWLAALRRDVAGARARFARALPGGPGRPTLRDVQLALARELGFPGWAALKRALAPDPAASANTLEQYDAMAAALLEAYSTGTPEAMERRYRCTWHRRSWTAMRTYVQLDLGKRPSPPGDPVDITLDDARYLIAVEHGFEHWAALTASVSTMPGQIPVTAKPVRVRSLDAPPVSRPVAVTRDWRTALRLLTRTSSPALDAEGQMTNERLADVAAIEDTTALNLSGSQALTDDGVRHLARLPNLRHLDLGGTAVTDRSLAMLADLPNLETISLEMTRVTDAGVVHLARCDRLQSVNLAMTRTGDAALRALAGKRLRHLRTGNGVTDAGLALLHELPMFKTWHGGEVKMGLLSYGAEPNYLYLRGPFTDPGMQQLRGLDGLFALNLDARELRITAAALAPLLTLPNLGWLAVDAKDDWMPYIAEMPRLRFLGAQDTPAGDDGFAALGRSRSIEYIWGRRCHNLGRRGFLALAEMPALRGLSVSCLNVDDAGLAALPRFPALKELMPMDVPDAGYRHIGRCANLESLILMYCRDTTDAATEHIAGLRKLTDYFNSYTTITDLTPKRLSGIDSMERITFDTCHGLTDRGVAALARLPRLKELRVSGRGVTPDVEAMFPAWVSVNPRT